MNYTIYNEEIKNYIDTILNARSTDVTLTLSCCRKLLTYGKEHQDNNILGFAYYYMGESYYFQGASKKQLISIFNALEHLQLAKNYDLIARSYNLLGILSNAQGNSNTAIDYYLQGLSICKKHDQHYVAAMIYSNISIIFTEVDNHKKAIEFLHSSLDCYELCEKTPALLNNLAVALIALGQSYLYLNEISAAQECMSKVEELLPQLSMNDIGISIWSFKAMLSDALGHIEDRDACIQEIVAMSVADYSLLTFYDDFLVLLRFLQNVGKDSVLMEILRPLEAIAAKDQNLHIQFELAKLKLNYYQRTEQDFLFLHTAKQFSDLSIKLDNANKKAIASSIDLRFALQELQNRQKKMEAENQQLILKSESDALTGLPNRYKMNDYSDFLLAKAFENQVPFGVEILDIDYFKQYNDTYGHQAGDECLIAIARELNRMTNNEIFCARYGGDEFIILYYNKTNEEIHALAEDLRQRICNLQIEHKNSKAEPFVTITQGIASRVPTPGNRMWDFLHAADTALYEGKKKQRNSITQAYCEHQCL